MSLTVASIIRNVDNAHPGKWAPQLIATTVSFVCGFIVLAIGLLRLGWLVEFIPAPGLSSSCYETRSAL
jgi:sodium-independent sulfate anion transporter 11